MTCKKKKTVKKVWKCSVKKTKKTIKKATKIGKRVNKNFAGYLKQNKKDALAFRPRP